MNREKEFERQARELESLLPECMLADRTRLGRQLAHLRRSSRRRGKRQKDPGAELARLRLQAETSCRLRHRRSRLTPSIQYPEELPISAARDEILKLFRQHPVIVVAGDTGSGKTTQIPKICLEAGRGREARIACTQPRRVAALSLSRRLAEELDVTWGREVGCKIRFRDRTAPETLVKMVTDGMLLAEIRGDPDLLEYDTVILDEAHERSLNIDFLLGYLRLLLQRRPDLKIVITSATIDTAKFSAAFGGAPIIQVSGRVYPVEVRYWPLEELLGDGEDFSYVDAAVCAVEKLVQESTSGDILLFMPGEHDIRETRDLLKGRLAAEVVPLFGRLTAAEQQRVFAPGPQRRVVVATNIAETSLTIPRIRYVVDAGLARLNRFNPSTQTQRLPIEAISRSSCDQRKGRCGRVQDGICVRLYSEEDFLSRPEHTQPEIQRADLAEVVLRMLELNLGDVHAFPFIDPPQPRAIEAGYRLLGELGAIDKDRRLSALGRDMARMATAPTVSRMVIQARWEDALPEVLIIAAAISIRDPRERPEELAAEADRQHRQFIDRRSDFLTLLHIWNTYHDRFEELKTQNQMRKFCRRHFLSFNRMREWRDIHAQLSVTAGELAGFRPQGGDGVDREPAGYDAIHRSILSGLMGNVACKKERNLYRAARGREVMLFPGSGLFQRKAEPPTRRTPASADAGEGSEKEIGGTPGWILAAEMVETSRLFARTAAAIQAAWLLELGEHICRSSYRDPHWSKRAGRVLVHETVRLHGLEIVTRSVAYRRVDPKEATEIFIREALVPGELRTQHPFLEHNQRLCDRIETWQTRLRQRQGIDIDEVAFEFYAGVALEDVSSVHDLNRVIRARTDGDRFLFMEEADLLGDLDVNVDLEDFPDAIVVDGEKVAIDYAYRPGQDEDGITAKLPYRLVDAVDPEVLEWLVPGLLQEKITCLLRSLPKTLRKQLIPVPGTARAITAGLTPSHDTFLESLEVFLLEHYGLKVRRADWGREAVPDYLRMRIDIQGSGGESLAAGRDLSKLAGKLARHDTPAETDAWKKMAAEWHRDGLTDWTGEPDLPERVEVTSVSGVPLFGYPGLQTNDTGVAVRLFKSRKEAEDETRRGLLRLHELCFEKDLGRLRRQLGDLRELAALCPSSSGGSAELREEAYTHLLHYLFEGDSVLPVTGATIAATQRQALFRLGGLAERFAGLTRELMETRREILACSWPYDGMAVDLQRLLPRHFLLDLPFPRLTHLCRYLKAILVRAERARSNSSRDASKAALVRPYQEALEQLAAPLEEGDSSGAALVQEFRWMVEEFRVSVFAQELGTAQPISPKRLKKKLDEVERM
ncbi:MAG: ATP-dependent RNA helicase HrpA [Candidatus Latescibacterota bacterium]|nr:ATP-dependent RNA helicase HrpA [Candidatus Latescibacterota bacterium]